MKIVADESVDRQIVERLRIDGHHVVYIAEMQAGIADDAVLDVANREDAPLLTADLDFGDLVFRQRLLTSGVVLIRLAGVPPDSKAEVVAAVIADHGGELPHAFSVIAPRGLRIRPGSI